MFPPRAATLRLVKPAWLQFRGLAVRRSPSAAHHTTGPTDPPVKSHAPALERYSNLQKYFKRRLRAIYSRFSDQPDHSVVSGRHHVYFVESDGIYRMDKRRTGAEAELVLYLGRCPAREGRTEGEQKEGREEEVWSIQRARLSPEEKHLAATLTTPGREEARCVVVKLGEAASQPDDPSRTVTLDKVFSFEWAGAEVLFYTTQDGLSCSRVFRLDLTSTGARVRPVLEDTQPDVFVEVALSRDRCILSINSSTKTDSKVWIIDVAAADLEPVLVQPRLPELMYHVEHWRGWLVLLANTAPGQEYQVLKVPLVGPSMDSWVPLYTPGPGVAIKDMEVVGDHCVLATREPSGELALTAVPLAHPTEAYDVELPSWACAIETKRPGVADHRGAGLEFLLSSPVHPQVPCRFHPEDGLLLLGTEVDGDPPGNGGHITTRLEARSQDNTMVPMTVFHSASAGCLTAAPLLVHVYGAYGRDLNMEFSPERRLLLEQGWVLAYCHIRGGGERGLSWHRQARAAGKPRGVEDLEACLRHLLSSWGMSSPSLTAVTACSAGAVPVGALCNAAPHLMRAVTLQAPFLDVLATMEDHRLPLTMEEREEWGDPSADPRDRLAIASYCPFHNIKPQCYPSMLLTAYSGDVRVPLTGVLKYTRRLEEAVHTYFTTHTVSEHEQVPNVVLKIQPGADHFGPQDFELALEESALQLAFLHTELRLEPPRRGKR